MGLKHAEQTRDAMLDFGIRDNDWPECFGKWDGRLLIVGGGRCVWDDVEPWSHKRGRGQVVFDGDVMAVNEIGCHFPGEIRHWYSNDPKELNLWWRRLEIHRELENRFPILTHSVRYGCKYRWPVPGHVNSGLNAAYIGCLMGYTEIILAGMPNDNSGHYFDPPWRRTNFLKEGGDPVKAWTRARDKFFFGKVKSLSGMTKDILGSS